MLAIANDTVSNDEATVDEVREVSLPLTTEMQQLSHTQQWPQAKEERCKPIVRAAKAPAALDSRKGWS